jgi:hypothetical protein
MRRETLREAALGVYDQRVSGEEKPWRGAKAQERMTGALNGFRPGRRGCPARPKRPEGLGQPIGLKTRRLQTSEELANLRREWFRWRRWNAHADHISLWKGTTPSNLPVT